MNESLYSFAVLRAEQAESYEQNDIKEFINRIDEQSHTIDAQALLIGKFEANLEEVEEIAKQQGFLATKGIYKAEDERKKRIRSGRMNKVYIIAAAVGGFYLGSR